MRRMICYCAFSVLIQFVRTRRQAWIICTTTVTKMKRRVLNTRFKRQVVPTIRGQLLSMVEVCWDMKLGDTAVTGAQQVSGARYPTGPENSPERPYPQVTLCAMLRHHAT